MVKFSVYLNRLVFVMMFSIKTMMFTVYLKSSNQSMMCMISKVNIQLILPGKMTSVLIKTDDWLSVLMIFESYDLSVMNNLFVRKEFNIIA